MILDTTVKSVNWSLDFGELEEDVEFVDKCNNLKKHLIVVQNTLQKLLSLRARYDELPIEHKTELDLLLLYMLTSLHWIELRLQGIDVTKHPIKREFDRIKAAMVRWKQVKDRNKRPKVNVEAAKRFVRSGLYDRTQNGNNDPPNKKIRFED